MDIIETSDTEREENHDDLDQCGGTPNTEELCRVALSVKSLPLACSLGRALRVNDDLIVGFIDLPSSSLLYKIARQLVDSWWNGLKKEEKEHKLAKLLSEFNIQDVKTVSTGLDEISKAIGSKTNLLDLCHRLSVKPSDILQIMSTSLTFPPHMIGRSALKMLKEWVHQGGTRERLLKVAQAFRFNDAAIKIAEGMKCQPSYMPFISHGIIDHKGGELTLDELGIAVSIPEGAIPKGMRSVVTLRVPTHDTPRIPVRKGEVVITPVIEGSLTQQLLKPATVVLPHCIIRHERKDDPSVILYTKTEPGKFGRMKLTPPASHILKDEIKFHTRHLQVWALSSTDLQGLQLRCAVFQPVSMSPAEKSTLRVYILHPYRNYIEVPIKSILSGKCSPLNFELQFSPEEKGKKNVHIDILQGSATRAEKEYSISIEDEPDYAVDHTDSQGRLQYVSNHLLEILTDVILITSLKDLKFLGYQLGFSYSVVEKHLNHPHSSFDSASRSGFGEMLRDWRRRVRPSEQVDELHLALQDAGLGHAAEVILPEPAA
ncbi:uncharacterized protein LOC105436970 [Strongylocentrotus purpuratus]|uniref:ZU5 domain-containing protein n=1 Tax=Strongylocentrotus purpuratus TaxID=7668 RepID=A0A7M7NFG7_STRPU|nr:uncharacterized protein LOC105436970 [Strongylocentrotus purpuratus]